MATTRADTITLPADPSVGTVTLTKAWNRIQVVMAVVGTSTGVYFTTDNSAPTQQGDDCYLLAAVVGAELNVPAMPRSDGTTVVKLITTGTTTIVTVIGR